MEYDSVVGQMVKSIFIYTRLYGKETSKYYWYLNMPVDKFVAKFKKTHFSNLDITEENLKYTIDEVRKDIIAHEEPDVLAMNEEWKKDNQDKLV